MRKPACEVRDLRIAVNSISAEIFAASEPVDFAFLPFYVTIRTCADLLLLAGARVKSHNKCR
jgi:hypothetical protein